MYTRSNLDSLTLIHSQFSSDRPAWVDFRGGRIAIYLHDVWYARHRLLFVSTMAALHTDRNATRKNNLLNGWCFRRVKKIWKRWEEDQLDYYNSFGLEPPRVPIRIVFYSTRPYVMMNRLAARWHGYYGEDEQKES